MLIFTPELYRSIALEVLFFTAIFALDRMATWLAHKIEFLHNPDRQSGRTHQHYKGPHDQLPVPPIDSRPGDGYEEP